MPRCKSLKSMFMEILMFLGMFALVGHLSMSFWERFIIQTELSKMRTSLYSLKETVHKIDYAYDNLHRELKGLTEETENKQSVLLHREYIQDTQRKQDHELNIKALHGMRIQSITKTNNHTIIATPILSNKTAQNEVNNRRTQTLQLNTPNKNKVVDKNVSTITRYPLKSTGVGIDVERSKSDFSHTGYCKQKTKANNNNIHKCRRVYHYAYIPYDKNWKF